jgi:hypothetical protein
MTFQLLIEIAAALWLASLAACVLAWRWSSKRFGVSIVLCLAALATGYLGLTRFQVTASKTVNGHTQWSFNSRWFFITTLALGALTLAYTIWKHQRSAPQKSLEA